MTRITDKYGRTAAVELLDKATNTRIDEILFRSALYKYSESKQAYIVESVPTALEATKSWQAYRPTTREITIRINA